MGSSHSAMHRDQGGESHLPGAEGEDPGGEDGNDGGRQDEQLPLVEVGGLLQLLHYGGIEGEADKQADPHDEEEACSDHVYNQVYGEVAHSVRKARCGLC